MHLNHMCSETQPLHFKFRVYQDIDVDIKLVDAEGMNKQKLFQYT
jgi:hypothetical protein